MRNNNIKLSLRIISHFVFTFLLITNSHSAEVKIVPDYLGDSIISISGEIVKGDLVKIKRQSLEILNKSNKFSKPLHFHLNTGGGNVDEAIKIGRFARDMLVSIDSHGKIILDPESEYGKKILRLLKKKNLDSDDVWLGSSEKLTDKHIVKNYSAGILIFYGAVERAHSDNSDQRLGFNKKTSIPVMGLHRPYLDKKYFSSLSPSEASKEYKKLENSVRSYLLEMGAPQSVLDDMFRYASNEVRLIKDDEFRKLYKSEESFFEEWLISQCGVSGDYKKVLSQNEYEDWPKIAREQSRKRMADFMADKEIEYGLKIYENKNFSAKYIEEVYRKIRKHNRTVNFCRKSAVINHQIAWANSVDSKTTE